MTQLPDTTTGAGQREASVMLAWLMGLAPQLFSDVCNFYHEDTYDIFVSIYPYGWYHGMLADEAWKYFPNLYDPASMALATRVYEWWYAGSVECDVKTGGTLHITDRFYNWLNKNMTPYKWDWFNQGLDEILSLAIEAGMLHK